MSHFLLYFITATDKPARALQPHTGEQQVALDATDTNLYLIGDVALKGCTRLRRPPLTVAFLESISRTAFVSLTSIEAFDHIGLFEFESFGVRRKQRHYVIGTRSAPVTLRSAADHERSACWLNCAVINNYASCRTHIIYHGRARGTNKNRLN